MHISSLFKSLLLICVLFLVCDRRMATHLLNFHITFGGKGNISPSTNMKVVKVCPILFDKEVRSHDK